MQTLKINEKCLFNYDSSTVHRIAAWAIDAVGLVPASDTLYTYVTFFLNQVRETAT